MALTSAAYRDYRASDQYASHQVAAAVTIYRGAFVGLNPAGYAKPFEAGDLFVGVAEGLADNASGAAGAINVQVRNGGFLDLPITTTIDDVGKPVFATDDESAAIALGHPDGFIGRVVQVGDSSSYAVVAMIPGDKLTAADVQHGPNVVYLDAGGKHEATGGTAGTIGYGGGLLASSALGSGVTDTGAGGVTGAFDAVAEVAHASLYGGIFKVSRGVTAEFELHLTNIGDDAALDTDWGLGSILTANSIADIDHADMAQLACFHMDGNSANILAQSDDATTDVAVVDTTVDNVTTAGATKKFKIVGRSSGAIEFWVDDDGAGYDRVLSSTTFAVSSAAVLNAFINMEKTSNDTVGSWVCKSFVAKGCWA